MKYDLPHPKTNLLVNLKLQLKSSPWWLMKFKCQCWIETETTADIEKRIQCTTLNNKALWMHYCNSSLMAYGIEYNLPVNLWNSSTHTVVSEIYGLYHTPPFSIFLLPSLLWLMWLIGAYMTLKLQKAFKIIDPVYHTYRIELMWETHWKN